MNKENLLMVLPNMVIDNLQTDLEILMRVVIAFLLGGLIGWERERHGGISAGIRTYGAISLGACVFGIVSFSIAGSDPSRIAAQVVSGIGFLGGGLIFRQRENHVSGLTTAATLWATAAVGLAVALGMYTISLLTAILIYALLFLPRLLWWKKLTGRPH
jgi:putative Mg2+ transporter-C (MgtC) family protein